MHYHVNTLLTLLLSLLGLSCPEFCGGFPPHPLYTVFYTHTQAGLSHTRHAN
jgi:hypothetical protein